MQVRERAEESRLFEEAIRISITGSIHTVQPLEVRIPKGRLTAVTGVSGSGKTTLILESLVPALTAAAQGKKLPEHVRDLQAEGIRQVKLIDASPIGINIRSTVATYANVHDELRKVFARTPDAREKGRKAGDFSYNTGKLRCPVCDGTGVISLDVQFLPDVQIPCPQCRGTRYAREAESIRYQDREGRSYSLPELMAMDVNTALQACAGLKNVCQRLGVLKDLGLGYLTLGEETPGLSGGEAQRLKLASEMGKAQSDSVFVFDEPTIGLHPLDVKTLLEVFQTLIGHGATVVVIEHDLDVIRNADYILDLGPAGGKREAGSWLPALWKRSEERRRASPGNLPEAQSGSDPSCQDHSQDHFDQIRDDKGQNTPGQYRWNADSGIGLEIYDREPDCAEGIHCSQPQDHDKDAEPQAGSAGSCQCPVKQPQDKKTCDVAAGASQENPKSGGEAGKYRDSGGAQQDVDQDGQGSKFAAQQGQNKEHGKGLQGKGNCRRDADPGTDSDQHSPYGGVGKLRGSVSFCESS